MTITALILIAVAGLFFSLGRAMSEWGAEKPAPPRPIPPEHLGYCRVCCKKMWADTPGVNYFCEAHRPGGGVKGDGAAF